MRNPRLHQHRRCPTVSSRCLGRTTSSHRRSSSLPSNALEMQHFLKDFATNSAGMLVHADETQCATTWGGARFILPDAVSSRSWSEIQRSYCSDSRDLKGLLMLTSNGWSSDVIPAGITTSSLFSLWILFLISSVRCPRNASKHSINGRLSRAPGCQPHTFPNQSSISSCVIHPFSWCRIRTSVGKSFAFLGVLGGVFLLKIKNGGSLCPSAVIPSITVIRCFSQPDVQIRTCFAPFCSTV